MHAINPRTRECQQTPVLDTRMSQQTPVMDTRNVPKVRHHRTVTLTINY